MKNGPERLVWGIMSVSFDSGSSHKNANNNQNMAATLAGFEITKHLMWFKQYNKPPIREW